MPSTNTNADTLLLTAEQVAALLGISVRQIFKLQSSGRLPQPLKLGKRVSRWRRDEIESWVAAGAPPRDRWESLQKRESGRTKSRP